MSYETDLRICDYINNMENVPGENPAAILIGFPCDLGVVRNGGRPGAAKAPEHIRNWLMKMTPHAQHFKQHTALLKRVSDGGNLVHSKDLEKNQSLLGEAVARQIRSETVPIIIGGGHETSYGHFLGYVQADMDVAIVNIDAHTDVRPLKDGKAHSGSPFRQALKHSSGHCSSYSVFGLNPQTVARDHLEYITFREGTAMFTEETTEGRVQAHLDKEQEEHIMVTMDMDAVVQSAAPGVSAPSPCGMMPDLWLKLAFHFGKHPAVKSFDLCEVNPDYDRDDQTVRLAAMTIWYFLFGLSLR